MAMTDDVFDEVVFRIRQNLGTLWKKIFKESKQKPDLEDFASAVLKALEEGFLPPKPRGGQKGNSNARRHPQTVNVEVINPDDDSDCGYAVAIGVMDD